VTAEHKSRRPGKQLVRRRNVLRAIALIAPIMITGVKQTSNNLREIL
jgi:hypothetical protein